MICSLCHKEQATEYCVAVPLPITKQQEWDGVMPSGDQLLSICKNCKSDRHRFYDPGAMRVIK